MISIPNFPIQSSGPISRVCKSSGLLSFDAVADYVMVLPFGRNPNKEDISSVFRDQCGTCSTKHALLKELARENELADLKLILGIVKMDAANTPQIAATLQKHNLTFIPEAHNYLRYKGQIFDYTRPNFTLGQTEGETVAEIEIQPNEITTYKVNYHKSFLANWLKENPRIPYSLEELWEIREQCIQDLSGDFVL